MTPAVTRRPASILLGLAAAGLVLAFALLLTGEETSRGEVDLVPSRQGEPAAPAAPTTPAPVFVQEEVYSAVRMEAAPGAGKPARLFLARGVVVDLHGHAVVGVPLACAHDGEDPSTREARGTTAGDGSFEFYLPRPYTSVVSADPAWTVVLGGANRPNGPPLRLVVAPSSTWTGWIRDGTSGQPITGARLHAVAPLVPALAELSRAPRVQAASGDDGAFHFPTVPAWPGTRLEIVAQGYLPLVLEPVPRATRLGMIHLEPGGPPAVRGVIRLPGGAPAVKASVKLGDLRTSSDEHGAFELFAPLPQPGEPLVARLDGHAPATAPGVGDLLLAGDAEGLELVLGGEGLAIEGRVVDPDGQPLIGWTVEVLGPEREPLDLELYTGVDGVFRIEGLGAGPYTLLGYGREEEGMAVALDVHAPRIGLELVRVEATRRLFGRVIGPDGQPAAGAQVWLDAGGKSHQRTMRPSHTWADAEGRFEFMETPNTPGQMSASPGSNGRGLSVSMEVPSGLSVPLELHLAAERLVRFEAGDPLSAPDALFPTDASGRPLEAFVKGMPRRALVLTGGRSGVFSVPEEATALVLTRFGRELDRISIPPASDGPVALARW